MIIVMKFPFSLKIFSLLVSLIFFLPVFVHAGAEHNMSGFAWSSNIGWISFNCTNDSSCGSTGETNYGVHMASDGSLCGDETCSVPGYAWSPNIGWIQFGSLSGFPTGEGTQAQNANVNGNNLKGWAKALSADGNGWDGWISLSGSGYSVNKSSADFTGYAWGGSVVGWILFDVQGQYPGVCSDCGVVIQGGQDADLVITGNGSSLSGNTSVPYNTIPTFTWTLTNISGGTTCSVSKTSGGGTAFVTVSGITSSGGASGNPLTDASYVYKIECTNGGNVVISRTVSFTVLPQPAGFTLGDTDSVRVQFLTSGASESEAKNIYVTAVGGYSNPVTLSISTPAPVLASTTISYSFDGGTTYSSNPTRVISNFATAAPFRVRVTRQSDAPVFTARTVIIRGSGSGVSDVFKSIVITPALFDPRFNEL